MVNRFMTLVCGILMVCLGMSADAVSDKESRESFLERKVRHETIDGVRWNYFSYKDGHCGFLGYKDANVLITAVRQSATGRIAIPSKIGTKEVVDIGKDAFRDCTNIVEVVVPSGIKRIGPQAFQGCAKLERVVLPEGLEQIDSFAFYRCPNLKSMNVPLTVTNIGACAVRSSMLSVSDRHPVYWLRNDALYDKRSWMLVSYDGTNSVFEVDSRTKQIGCAAFLGRFNLRELRFSEGLEVICPCSILSCARLEHLEIPSTVTNIGAAAFSHCGGLSAIYYKGRKPECAPDVYKGINGVFTFVRKGFGWESMSGLLPQRWPDLDATDDTMFDKAKDSHCYAIQYWDGAHLKSRDELNSLQNKFYEEESVRGNTEAQRRLAWRYEHGIAGLKKDVAKAVDYLQGVAIRNDDHKEMYKIGDFYRKGINGKSNYAEAYKWYVRSLEGGDEYGMRACQELANLYRRGLGVEKDEETAFLLNLIAASHDMTGAQCVLSDCYERGVGVEPNAVEAAHWLNAASKKPWHGHELGLWYRWGGGVVDSPNPEKAFYWFLKSSEWGNGASAGEVAMCYSSGYGVKADPAKAYEYYCSSAEKGWSFGMNGVGECFEKGMGVKTNIAEAARWYIRAAERDRDYWDGGAALIKAGDCYANGFGVTKDYAKAKEWYAKAVERRHSETARLRILDLENKMRNEKNRKMTPKEKKADFEAHLAWCKKVEAAMPGDFLKVLDGFYGERKNERDFKMTESLQFGFEVAACICTFCDKGACTRIEDSLSELMKDAQNYSSRWHGRLHSAISVAKSQDGKSLLVISTKEALEAVKEWIAEQGGQVK